MPSPKHHAHDRIAIADAHRQLQWLCCPGTVPAGGFLQNGCSERSVFDCLVIFYRKFFQLSGIGFFDQTDRDDTAAEQKPFSLHSIWTQFFFQFGQFFVYVVIAACHLDRSIPTQNDIDAAPVSFLHNRDGSSRQRASAFNGKSYSMSNVIALYVLDCAHYNPANHHNQAVTDKSSVCPSSSFRQLSNSSVRDICVTAPL